MDLVRVGIIGKPIGLKGEVYIISKTDTPLKRFQVGNSFYLQNPISNTKVLEVKSKRTHNDRYILSFQGFESRQLAENLHNHEIYAEKIIEDDAYYFDDLIGLTVIKGESEIGNVSNIINNSAQDLLEIAFNDKYKQIFGKNKSLLPFVDNFIESIDNSANCIKIDPPEGLFELK